jgi:putative ABC transport system ATP-binding protein
MTTSTLPGTDLAASARGLTRVYGHGDTAVHALRGVDLDLPAGRFTAIMGPSGSGKSTLMHCLAGLDTPTSGTVTVAGRALQDMDDTALTVFRREHVGFVFQSFNLLARVDALGNVELPMIYRGLGRRARRDRAAEALHLVGLGDRMRHRPTQLSGGQQQRVAIARALVNGPDLLLADEPTGALDSRTGLEIMALFQALNRAGVAILMVTHDPEVAAFAGRTLRFRDGRLVGDTRQVPSDAAAALDAAGRDLAA